MSQKAITKLTPKEREEFKEYLEIHWMPKGKSLWEIVAGALVQAFLGIKQCKIKSQSSSPLPPKWVRLVFIILVDLGPSLEPDVSPVWTS